MRTIKEIIIHCSATIEDRDYTVADIDRWHRARGWKGIGYHFVIYRDGSVHAGRPKEQVGAHCKGHNAFSIGICYIGGLGISPHKQGEPERVYPKDTRTPEQKESLRSLLSELLRTFPNLSRSDIHGHNEFANKACPCFKVPEGL